MQHNFTMESESLFKFNFLRPGPPRMHNSTLSSSRPWLRNSTHPRWLRNSTHRSSFGKHPAISLERYFENNMYIYYGTVSPLISVFVFCINILLIVTLIKGKFRMSTHVMMIAIATADCLTGLVPLPFNVYVFGLEKGTDYLTLTWCYIHEYLQKFLPEILHISSLHLAVGLGIERFIVVSFPLKAKRICTLRNGIIFSIAIFVVSVCSQIDLFTQVTFQSTSVRSRKSNTTITGCSRSEKARTDAEYTLRIAFLIFLPCLTLIIVTVLLLRRSREIQQWRKLNSSASQQKSSNVQALERLDLAVVLIMTLVVVSEVTVWTSYIMSTVYRIRFTKSHEELRGIGHIIFLVTSPINFVILCFLSSQFRDVFRQTFCCCVVKGKRLNFLKDKKEQRVCKHTSEKIKQSPDSLQTTPF